MDNVSFLNGTVSGLLFSWKVFEDMSINACFTLKTCAQGRPYTYRTSKDILILFLSQFNIYNSLIKYKIEISKGDYYLGCELIE